MLYGEVGWEIYSPEVVQALRTHADATEVRVRINSNGGSVFDGVAIYNALRTHTGHVVVDIDGLAASIASVIALAGDEVRIASNAMMMIHNAWSFVAGNARELRHEADVLDAIDEQILGVYQRHTGQDAKELSAWMEAETWFTAARAHELGFVDQVTDELELKAASKLDLSGFRNVPEDVNERFRASKVGVTTGELPQKVSKHMSKALMKALGLSEDATEADGIMRASQLVNHLATLKEITGKDSPQAAIGHIRGIKAKADKVDEMQAELDNQKLAAKDTEREALLKAHSSGKDRKLTPAMVAHYRERKVDPAELRATIEVLPVVAVTHDKPAEGGGDGATYNGKRYEEMTPNERAALAKSDREMFNHLRTDAQRRDAI